MTVRVEWDLGNRLDWVFERDVAVAECLCVSVCVCV